nr:DUF1566 domain-containing protein [Nitrospinaceae bacterium]NIR55431.1 DUF1566 domain-containing protein [Nitrospinaceae bacterium]NIS85871.1 DUF1566 domain-containing protein [Nitrospinaceae bacterium]NIT82715.1 DUF1566 domain-containing protein [Nitrospinaceae bacterium]NIU44924.1 DUF1566 domain-containing protein [Nitrospinaceae bacterium]
MSEISTQEKTRFVDNRDGTVTDHKTGLMWMKDDTWIEKGRLLTWHESVEYMRQKNEDKFAGYDDWHLPTASEAKTLFH